MKKKKKQQSPRQQPQHITTWHPRRLSYLLENPMTALVIALAFLASVRAENNPEQTPDIKRNDITGMNVYRQDEREYYYFDLSPEHLPKSIKSLEEKVEQSLIELNMKNLELNAGVLLGLGSDSPLALCGHVIAKSQKRDFAGLAEYYEKLAELEDSYVKKMAQGIYLAEKGSYEKNYTMIRESIEYLQELDNYEPYNAEFDNGVKQYRRQVISHISDSTAVDNASNNNATPTTNDDTAQAHHSAENFFADIKQALEANDYQAAFRHETAMLDQYFDDETVLGNLLVLKLEHLAEHETTQYSHNSDAIYLLLPETPQTYIANFAKGANLATRIDQGEIHLITKAIYYIKNALKLNSKSNTCKNMLKILGEKLSLETNFFQESAQLRYVVPGDTTSFQSLALAQPGQFSSFSIAHANLYSLPLLLSSQTNWILNHENYTANNSNELCCIIYNQEREQYSTYKIHTNQNNFILSAHRNNRQNIELWPTMPIGNGIEDNIVGILTPDGKLIKSDQELSEYVLAARKSKSTSTTELIYLFLATLFTSGFIFMILRWIWPDPKVVVPDNIAETTTQPIPPADEPFDLDIFEKLKLFGQFSVHTEDNKLKIIFTNLNKKIDLTELKRHKEISQFDTISAERNSIIKNLTQELKKIFGEKQVSINELNITINLNKKNRKNITKKSISTAIRSTAKLLASNSNENRLLNQYKETITQTENHGLPTKKSSFTEITKTFHESLAWLLANENRIQQLTKIDIKFEKKYQGILENIEQIDLIQTKITEKIVSFEQTIENNKTNNLENAESIEDKINKIKKINEKLESNLEKLHNKVNSLKDLIYYIDTKLVHYNIVEIKSTETTTQNTNTETSLINTEEEIEPNADLDGLAYLKKTPLPSGRGSTNARPSPKVATSANSNKKHSKQFKTFDISSLRHDELISTIETSLEYPSEIKSLKALCQNDNSMAEILEPQLTTILKNVSLFGLMRGSHATAQLIRHNHLKFKCDYSGLYSAKNALLHSSIYYFQHSDLLEKMNKALNITTFNSWLTSTLNSGEKNNSPLQFIADDDTEILHYIKEKDYSPKYQPDEIRSFLLTQFSCLHSLGKAANYLKTKVMFDNCEIIHVAIMATVCLIGENLQHLKNTAPKEYQQCISMFGYNNGLKCQNKFGKEISQFRRMRNELRHFLRETRHELNTNDQTIAFVHQALPTANELYEIATAFDETILSKTTSIMHITDNSNNNSEPLQPPPPG